MKKLTRRFYSKPTLEVAKKLLGKILVFKNKAGIITETEAYIGQDDPACHAARGKTPRNEVMFGRAGHSYIYFIYGMYFCLNAVTEREDFPAAVLIRGVQEIDLKTKELGKLYDGPGKLCKFFGLTKENNCHDLTTSDHFYILDTNKDLKARFRNLAHIKKTPRVGIKVGTDKLWRFVVEE